MEKTDGSLSVVQQDDYLPFGMDISIGTVNPPIWREYAARDKSVAYLCPTTYLNKLNE